jgi:hypothetical protein
VLGINLNLQDPATNGAFFFWIRRVEQLSIAHLAIWEFVQRFVIKAEEPGFSRSSMRREHQPFAKLG